MVKKFLYFVFISLIAFICYLAISRSMSFKIETEQQIKMHTIKIQNLEQKVDQHEIILDEMLK